MGILITIGLIAVLACLAAAGYFMLNGGKGERDQNKRMATALGFRVAISITLFLSLLLAWKMGWITPRTIP